MKKLYIIGLLCLAQNIFSQIQVDDYFSVWSGLKTTTSHNYQFVYSESLVNIVDRKIQSNDDYEYTDIAQCTLNGNKYSISILCGIGYHSRNDYGIALIKRNDNGFTADDIKFYADVICIPNANAIYTKTNINGMIVSKKYVYDGVEYKEINQPFYGLDVSCVIRSDIIVYSDIDMTDRIAVVASGSDIQIIGIMFENTIFIRRIDVINNSVILLVKTKTGIVGYIKPRSLKNWDDVKDGEDIPYDIPNFSYIKNSAG